MMRHLLTSILALWTLWGCGPLWKPERTDSEAFFSSGEHMLLGDAAYFEACSKVPICPRKLLRGDQRSDFSYGEIVAFSGDFYAHPDGLYLEEQNKDLFHPLLNDVDKVKSLMKEEAEFFLDQAGKGGTEAFPDHSIGLLFAFPDYLKLALHNIDHFGWHNMKAYVRHHRAAIDLAREAHAAPSDEEASKLLQRALFLNGFADHFLSDAFAMGHIRNPRAEVTDWGEAGRYPRLAVQSLAKLLHDLDRGTDDDGRPSDLRVRNARGDSWQTRGDSQLFRSAEHGAPYAALPREALILSLEEVLLAAREGKEPIGIFAASELVPFPDPSEPPLTSLFAPDAAPARLKQWLAGLGIISKAMWLSGLNEDLARRFFSDLPALMDAFRNRVILESEGQMELGRLPEAYIFAYRSIR